jgi:hypothetical protein
MSEDEPIARRHVSKLKRRRRQLKRRHRQDQSAHTMSVPDAGREYFDLGRNASYEAAKRGEIPVILIGRKKRAVVAAIHRMLEEAGRTGRDDSK